jgi:xanthine dehydrogenase accessory factor
MNSEVFTAVSEVLARGESAALVTIIRTNGSTPQRVGAKMLVLADGRTVGTIGGGCYEADAFWKAKDVITSGRPQTLRYELSDDLAAENGLICGGQMEVFIEPIEPASRLYVIGAGHVGQQLARVASDVGFRVHVVDDREKFANAERFPTAAEIVVDSIPDWLHRTEIPTSSFVVILTRGHVHDLDALRALAARDLRYLGLIGSKAKVARLYEALQQESLPAECLARVHAPVGLDIGAVTPQEIAVSILAEMIGVRHHNAEQESFGRPLRWTPKLV